MKSGRTNLSERALIIFLLHYYSADWIRSFLLGQRFKAIFHEQLKSTDRWEDDLLLCLKASMQFFPTARGLKEIDYIVTNKSATTGSGESSDSRFAIFNKNFCIDIRYRMSLLKLAENAREYCNNTLANLWEIAATAKLDHVSAWHAYAAAKEEESRLLNHTILVKYWQSQKKYMGDVKEKAFDITILNMHYCHEFEEKEAEFRRFLHSKVDPSLHSTVDTCDLKGRAFLHIYCNLKANGLKTQCSNRLWQLANDLYGKQDSSAALINEVISSAIRLEHLVERLQSSYKLFRSRCRNNSPFTCRWMKASRFLEDVMLKLRTLIDNGLKNASERHDHDSDHIIQRTLNSIERVDTFLFCGYFSFVQTIKTMPSSDRCIQEVMDALPILTSHPEHVFPNLRNLLQTFCQDFETSNIRYIEASEEIVRYHLQMLNPPAEPRKLLGAIQDERDSKIALLHDHKHFLDKFQRFIERKSRIKEEIYVKVLHSFADSYYTVNINNYFRCSLPTIKSARQSFLEKFREVFSFAKEASQQNIMITDVNSELLEIKLELIYYSTLPEWKDSKLFEMLKHAISAMKEVIHHKPLELIKKVKEYREAIRLLVKGEEIRRNSGILPKRKEQRMLKLADLYCNAAKWTEQVANKIDVYWPGLDTYRLKANKYLEAIKAFEGGDEKLASSYAKQALQMK